MYECLKQGIRKTIREISDGTPMVEVRKVFHRSLALREGWAILVGPLLHGVGYINASLPKFEYPHHNTGYPDEIRENMVLAVINIGLYARQGWGVRYEDTFVVTKELPKVLTGGGAATMAAVPPRA